MSWQAIGAIGEVVGALAVAVTLAFLVVQVRQNSKAINATITHGNIAGFNELNSMLAANPELAEISTPDPQVPASVWDETERTTSGRQCWPT